MALAVKPPKRLPATALAPFSLKTLPGPLAVRILTWVEGGDAMYSKPMETVPMPAKVKFPGFDSTPERKK